MRRQGPGGFANLAQSENPYRAMALEALVIHYEHREKKLGDGAGVYGSGPASQVRIADNPRLDAASATQQ